MSSKILSPLIACLFAGTSFGQLVINELDADTPTSPVNDNMEFVELYDGGAGNTALDGYVLVFYNGSDDQSYFALDLDGLSTNANGLFVAGTADLLASIGWTGSSNSIEYSNNTLQNGEDGVALFDGFDDTDFPDDTVIITTNLVDAIVYETGSDSDSGLIAGFGINGEPVDERGLGDGATDSIGRTIDGGTVLDSTLWQAFDDPTPGALNEVVAELNLSFDVSTISESSASVITATLLQDGDVNQPLDVVITNPDPTELSMPAMVTIPGDGTGETTFTITPVDDGEADGDQMVTITASAASLFPAIEVITVQDDGDIATLVVNEVHGDVEANTDTNSNGVTDFQGDEFVELVNISGADLDISGWTLSDNEEIRHVFGAGTILAADCALVVFGSGVIEGRFETQGAGLINYGSALLLNASSGAIGLNNTGDTVLVADTGGIVRASATFGAFDGPNGSETRSIDADGTEPFVSHNTVSGLPYSPGTTLGGAAFCPVNGALSITLTGAASFGEAAGAGASAATVSRTGDTSSALTVEIVNADASELALPATVTIAAGQFDAPLPIGAVDDSFVDYDQLVTIGASATNYSGAFADVTVTDDENPATGDYIVINEVDTRQVGDDRAEFIELYDGGVGNTPLDGYVVIALNGAQNSTTGTYVAWDLDGFSTNAAGFFVIGTLGGITNADIDVFAFGSGFLQNGGDDAIALYAKNASDFLVPSPPTTDRLVDAMMYGGDEVGNTFDAIFGITDLNVAVDADEDESMSRLPDGGARLSLSVYGAGFPTPGAPNMATGGGGSVYDTWAAGFPGIGARTDDDDFDGIPNVLEFGLGFDPTEFDSLPAPTIDPGTGNLRFTVPKGPDAAGDPDTAYFAATSFDGEDWSNVDLSIVTDSGTSFAAEYTGTEPTVLLRIGVNVNP